MTDRQTDGWAMTYSEREPFAKNNSAKCMNNNNNNNNTTFV